MAKEQHTPDTIWPRYTKRLYPDQAAIAGLIFQAKALRALIVLLGLVLLYYLGILLQIPTISDSGPVGQESWWFLVVFDQLLTGGAFSRGAVFCLGLVAVVELRPTRASASGRTKIGWLQRLANLSILSALATAIFAIRGLVQAQIMELVLTFFLVALGGIAVYFINLWLVRHQGPDVIHLNIFYLLYLHFDRIAGGLLLHGEVLDTLIVAGMVAFMITSAIYVFRSRVHLHVENIKSPADKRWVTLELPGVDAHSLDFLGLVSVVLFISLAGVFSLLSREQTLSVTNFTSLFVISSIVILGIWALIALVGKILRSQDSLVSHARALLDSGEVVVFNDPHQYAQRMINGYWIIPGIAAGRATEDLIAEKLRSIMTKSFGLFALWFVVVSSVQLYSIHYRGELLLPYGPLVFIFLFTMTLGNVLIMGRNLRSKLRHQQYVLRGKTRVAAETYFLDSPTKLPHLLLQEDATGYPEELLAEKMREIRDWIRLLREVQIEPRQVRLSPKQRLVKVSSQIVVGTVAGLLFALLGGVPYVLLVPSAEANEIWAVVIPLFITGMLSPNVAWNLMTRTKSRKLEED